MVNRLRMIASFAVLFAFIVVVLGAYTRLRDAGLGCPDWPGCYGHWVVQSDAAAVQAAEQHYQGSEFQGVKAWTEMIHRYAAGSLGLCILLMALAAIRSRWQRQALPFVVPLLLVAVVIMQATLGMWTVTLKLLPTIVTLHLLGGFAIITLLWLYYLQIRSVGSSTVQQASHLMRWARFGLVVLVLQIMLGGWTSTNYAAMSCPDFPYCQGRLLPTLSLTEAFNVLSPIGINYEGGVLGNQARLTIHMVHRLGAVITALYLTALPIAALCSRHRLLRRIAAVMLVLLLAQLSLGIANVVFALPLPVAVSHNAVAALLLLSLVTLNFYSAPVERRYG